LSVPADAAQNYSGAIEVSVSGGALLGVIHVSIENLDSAVWSAESIEPINVQEIDPGGETVMVRLAEGAHPRSGEVAVAHLQLRGNHVLLAGNHGFHAATG
jgi:hypothetical protein